MNRFMTLQTRATSQRGLSLTEVVVYVGLFAVIAIIAGSVFITYFNGEQAVQSVTHATNTGQVVTKHISQSIRSAATIRVEPQDTDNSQFLTAKIGYETDTGPTWECEAWYFTAGGELYSRTASTTIAEPTDLTGWTRMASGILPNATGDAYISPDTISVPVGDSVELSIQFQIDSGDHHEPVAFNTSVVNWVQNIEEGPTC